MVLREDYIDNRLERISKNITYLKSIIENEPNDTDLLNSLARLQSEYLELIHLKMQLEEIKKNQRNIPKKLKKPEIKIKKDKKGEQLSLF